MDVRHVKLFRSGESQAVQIPRGFELPGEDATIRREGEKLIIEAVATQSLLSVLAGLAAIDGALPVIDDPPPGPVAL